MAVVTLPVSQMSVKEVVEGRFFGLMYYFEGLSDRRISEVDGDDLWP